MHFGWNIGKAFSKKRIHTATFIKNVFAHALRDIEISTIERKMSHAESKCEINLDHYCPVKAGKSVFEIVET